MPQRVGLVDRVALDLVTGSTRSGIAEGVLLDDLPVFADLVMGLVVLDVTELFRLIDLAVRGRELGFLGLVLSS